jgi:hypothetical protein
LRPGHQFGPEGIALDMPGDGQKMLVRLHGKRLTAPLIHGPVPAV